MRGVPDTVVLGGQECLEQAGVRVAVAAWKTIPVREGTGRRWCSKTWPTPNLPRATDSSAHPMSWAVGRSLGG